MRSHTRFPSLLFTALFLLLPALVTFPQGAWAQETNAPLTGTYGQLIKNYRAALQDAQEIRVSKIDTHLTLISKSNTDLEWKTIGNEEYVKVALLSDTFYDAYVGKTLSVETGRTTWVGAAADFKKWYAANHPAATLLLLRLKQLMGMPPDVMKTRMVELWVRPADMKRPSIEPAVDKNIDLAALFARKDSNNQSIWFRPDGDEVFNKWFYRQCAESYVVPPDDQSVYPWTRLGYTYDLGNPVYPHIGLSEFVVWGGDNVKVYVESSKTPELYFQDK